MKSFFALAAAFALTIVPAVLADPVDANTPARFFSNFAGGLVFGARKIILAPAPGAPLVIATPGDGSPSDPTAWILTAGTNSSGQIQLLGPGRRNTTLCVTSAAAQSDPNSVLTVDVCNATDKAQSWFIFNGNFSTIDQEGNCLTIQGENPQPGNRVTLARCDEGAPGRLWNAVSI